MLTSFTATSSTPTKFVDVLYNVINVFVYLCSLFGRIVIILLLSSAETIDVSIDVAVILSRTVCSSTSVLYA